MANMKNTKAVKSNGATHPMDDVAGAEQAQAPVNDIRHFSSVEATLVRTQQEKIVAAKIQLADAVLNAEIVRQQHMQAIVQLQQELNSQLTGILRAHDINPDGNPADGRWHVDLVKNQIIRTV